jgi:hypothetical protein
LDVLVIDDDISVAEVIRRVSGDRASSLPRAVD